jgi:precorrin-6A/cobalt-precorrin-6A reductase
VVGRPPFDRAAEAALFRSLGVTHVRGQGRRRLRGPGKLDAARDLGLPVLLLRRPSPPAGMAAVRTVEEALDWAAALPFRSGP